MWFCALALIVVLVGCDPISDQTGRHPSPVSSDHSSTAPSPSKQTRSEDVRRCIEEIPFTATYLPDGFDDELYEGRAEGYKRPDRKGQVIFHYRGSEGRSIEVRRPATFFSELAQGDDAPTIEVLGTETAGFAPITPGGDDFIVQFTYPTTAPSTNDCAIYSLNESGVSLSELKKVAEGLRLKR